MCTYFDDIHMYVFLLFFFRGASFSQLPPQLSASVCCFYFFFSFCFVFFSSAYFVPFLGFAFAFLLFILFLFAFRLLRLIKMCFSPSLPFYLSLPLFLPLFVVVIEASLEYFYFIYLWFFFLLFFSFCFCVCVADCFARSCSLQRCVYRDNTLKYFWNCFIAAVVVVVVFLGRCGLCIKINWLDKLENRKRASFHWFGPQSLPLFLPPLWSFCVLIK